MTTMNSRKGRHAKAVSSKSAIMAVAAGLSVGVGASSAVAAPTGPSNEAQNATASVALPAAPVEVAATTVTVGSDKAEFEFEPIVVASRAPIATATPDAEAVKAVSEKEAEAAAAEEAARLAAEQAAAEEAAAEAAAAAEAERQAEAAATAREAAPARETVAAPATTTQRTATTQAAAPAPAPAPAPAATPAPAPAPAPAAVPAGNSSVVGIARSLAGSPYVYGAAGPYAFDCSGFTMYVYAKVGISLPRSSSAQRYAGVQVPASQARPGDLVWWPGHVGIYTGNGQHIAARNPSSGTYEGPVYGNPIYIRVG